MARPSKALAPLLVALACAAPGPPPVARPAPAPAPSSPERAPTAPRLTALPALPGLPPLPPEAELAPPTREAWRLVAAFQRAAEVPPAPDRETDPAAFFRFLTETLLPWSREMAPQVEDLRQSLGALSRAGGVDAVVAHGLDGLVLEAFVQSTWKLRGVMGAGGGALLHAQLGDLARELTQTFARCDALAEVVGLRAWREACAERAARWRARQTEPEASCSDVTPRRPRPMETGRLVVGPVVGRVPLDAAERARIRARVRARLEQLYDLPVLPLAAWDDAAALAAGDRLRARGPSCARRPGPEEVLRAQHAELVRADVEAVCQRGECQLVVGFLPPHGRALPSPLPLRVAASFTGDARADATAWEAAAGRLETRSWFRSPRHLGAAPDRLALGDVEVFGELEAAASTAALEGARAALERCTAHAGVSRVDVALRVEPNGRVADPWVSDAEHAPARAACVAAALRGVRLPRGSGARRLLFTLRYPEGPSTPPRGRAQVCRSDAEDPLLADSVGGASFLLRRSGGGCLEEHEGAVLASALLRVRPDGRVADVRVLPIHDGLEPARRAEVLACLAERLRPGRFFCSASGSEEPVSLSFVASR